MTVFNCQKNEVHSLRLQYLHLNQSNKNLIFWKEQWKCRTNARVLPFNKFELPHPEEDNCCSWKVHFLTKSWSSGRIRLLIISSVDFSNVTRISIHLNMLCSQNMLFTFSSFVNSIQVNDTLPSSSVGHLYRTYSTLLVSLGLTPWLNSLSWSLRPLNVTLRHRTFNLWDSLPLNCAWTSIHPAIVSNIHNMKLKTINEKLIQTFHQTLRV